ncbi:uncharacterized protein LOC108214255 isoform X2 [Daucus carota subsp. sativus]|uniref:uncharacterized protein LOC108214255 isoform X2 n=1 Tax=Daucus carota subsp. sativus TaxID=79200 RepID=UPI0030827027
MAVASVSLAAQLQSPPSIRPLHCRSLYSTSNGHSSFKSKPPFPPQKHVLVAPVRRRGITVGGAMLNLNSGGPLISPQDHWGIWAALFATATFGLWSERTKIGSMISAALVTILVGIAASNLGVIPYEAPAYSVVFQYLLPLTIPLLLFRADMWNVIHSTGTLFSAFLLGSAVNYIAIGEALKVSPSVLAAGVAADNVICAIYFVILFMLASKIPAEPPSSNDGAATEWTSGSNLPVLQSAAAIAISMALCKSAMWMSKLLGVQGGILPIVTALVVILATLLPTQFAYIAPAGDAIAVVLMQVFFAVLGASGSIWNVINTAPSIFVFALIQVTVHLLVILGLGKLFQLDLKLLLLASNANIGGPTTACGMATAKGWGSLVVPGILVGIFGVSLATLFGISFGLLVLKNM